MKHGTVIVVGAGLIGVTSAHALQARGFDVTIIDANSGPALGASFANAGMIHAGMSGPWNSPGVGKHLAASIFDPNSAMKLRVGQIPNLFFWGLKFLRYSTPSRHQAATENGFKLSYHSAAHTRALAKKLSEDFDYSDIGTLKIYDKGDDLQKAAAEGERLSSLGFEYKILNRQETIDLEPALAESDIKIAGSMYNVQDDIGDAYKFTQALTAQFLKRGGTAEFDNPVQRMIVENGTCVGVVTRNGERRADVIAMAAGSRSDDLMPRGASLAVRPAKGYSLTVDMAGYNDRPVVPIVVEELHCAITPLGSKIRIAGTAEFAGHNTDLTPARIKNLRTILGQVYPGLTESLDMEHAQPWAGFRPMPADGLPFIGESKVPGLWVNTGHGHLGWTMAAGSADVLADLMAGTPPKIDAAPYRADR